jgi:hypothetical protein
MTNGSLFTLSKGLKRKVNGAIITQRRWHGKAMSLHFLAVRRYQGGVAKSVKAIRNRWQCVHAHHIPSIAGTILCIYSAEIRV